MVARVFTREEFYQLVWLKPMTQLAKEFALSDVALHKICRKNDIPNPPPGWWAKKAAGKKVTQAPLPKVKSGTSDRITIAGDNLTGEPNLLAAAREEARIRASSDHPDGAATTYPIVERTIDRLRKAKPSERGLVAVDGAALIKCEVASTSLDRLAVILSQIAEAAARQGFRLVAGREQQGSEAEPRATNSRLASR